MFREMKTNWCCRVQLLLLIFFIFQTGYFLVNLKFKIVSFLQQFFATATFNDSFRVIFTLNVARCINLKNRLKKLFFSNFLLKFP